MQGPYVNVRKNVDLYFTFQNIAIDTDTMTARQRSTRRRTWHRESSFQFIFPLRIFYLSTGNHCRHSKIVSQAENRLSDKPATDFAASLSIFISLLQENPPILQLPKFQQFPENIQINGGPMEQIEFTELLTFTESKSLHKVLK